MFSESTFIISLLFLSRFRVVTSCMSSWPNTRSIYACFPAHSSDCAVEDNKGWGTDTLFCFSFSQRR
jgi:hypothetical protein